MPEIHVSLLGIALAVVVSFFFGFVWYTIIFGRAWALEMGFDPDEKPERREMIRGMLLMVLGNFFLAWVFAHNIAVWNPETWGLAPAGVSAFASAGMAAFYTWLGFFVPVLLSGVAWEKKSWKLFSINAAYHLLALFLVASILTHF
jgi:Protein of unknown function (DUF1761)